MSTLKQPRLLLAAAARVIVEYLVLTLGVLIFDLALDWFLVPNHIATGGVTGLAVVLNARLGWPVGLVILVVNVPLLLAGFRYLGGREFALRTMYATFLIGATVDPLALVAHPITRDPLLGALYGGVMVGVGIGTIYHWRGSTAGSDIVALLLKRFVGVKVGSALLVTDGLIILTAGLFLNFQVALYALVGVYIKSKVVDGMLKTLKAKNLSRVRRPTGIVLLPTAALSQASGSLVAVTPIPGGLHHREEGMALPPARRPSASRLLSALLPYAELEREGIGGQGAEDPAENVA
jgi:uncharacterized membrane-anchored protein YitT (DUF2179 family)